MVPEASGSTARCQRGPTCNVQVNLRIPVAGLVYRSFMERPPEMGDPAQRRLSRGFSLDDAARLHGMMRPGAAVTCPSCGGAMSVVSGGWSRARIQLLRCEVCGRGLVLDFPPRPVGA
jgi:hypothetical protein